MWPCNLELTVRGVYSGTVEKPISFPSRYFDELLGDKGSPACSGAGRKCRVVPDLIERIDAAFANSDAETKTETNQFPTRLRPMLGNLKRLIGGISSVIVSRSCW